ADERVGILHCLALALAHDRFRLPDAIGTHIAAVTGNRHRHGQTRGAARREIAGWINPLAVQHVERKATLQPRQKDAIPVDEKARGEKTRMAHDGIWQFVITNPVAPPWPRRKDNDLLP